MVVTDLPATALSGVTQERVAAPSMCTVQAPHWATPQPNLVPVSSSSSRTTHNSGVSGSTSTCRVLPLTVKVIMATPHVVVLGSAESTPCPPGRPDEAFGKG